MTILCLGIFVNNGHTSMLRVGFSNTIMGDVNENDAMAAVKVWAEIIARERHLPADPNPRIFQNVTDIAGALADRAVDCINISLIEYVELGELVAGDNVVVAVKSDAITETYVLLVHRNCGIKRLDDLKGQTLNLLQHSRACLGSAWLDILLARKNLGHAADFFGQIVPVSKTGKAILPVFFHQVGACLATRNGFKTMVELNPQTGQDLKVLATSPPLIPVVFSFRSDYDAPAKKQLMDELSRWHLHPAGRQLLTLFQTDRLEKHPVSCLDVSVKLLAEHQKLFGGPPMPPRKQNVRRHSERRQADGTVEPQVTTFQMGVSNSMFSEVGKKDAKAAIKIRGKADHP